MGRGISKGSILISGTAYGSDGRGKKTALAGMLFLLLLLSVKVNYPVIILFV
ncbi:hypothetical protein ACDX78_19975 [Virgibacillus oceani]